VRSVAYHEMGPEGAASRRKWPNQVPQRWCALCLASIYLPDFTSSDELRGKKLLGWNADGWS
jgi:hypothetical protein